MISQTQDVEATVKIATAIESLLFVSGRPLERAELRKLLNVDDVSLTSGLQELAEQ